jgi:hypothetical protein
MTNPCQEPTPDQEKMHEMQGEIDYLREQLREAYAIISDIDCSGWDRINAWIDQNAALAKAEAVKERL